VLYYNVKKKESPTLSGTSRWHVINFLITTHKYNTYLEIGVRKKKCYNKIIAPYKVCVDSKTNATHMVTSDEFFSYNKETFDIIFIDGDHLKEQIHRDIQNSLNILNKDGTIICHDMNPLKESWQLREQGENKTWTGDGWKEWVRLRATDNSLNMYVINTNFGCGVIQRGSQELIDIPDELSFSFLDKNRNHVLNLVSRQEFVNFYNE